VEGTNFSRTTYAYDDRGRLNRTGRADGTIFRSVFDGLGRITSQWIGPDDVPISGDWSPGNPADMELVGSYEYDAGGIGDSLVTTFADALNNETQYEYDFRGRLFELTQPDPDGGGVLTSPVWLYAYDNLNRVIQMTDPLTHVTAWLYEDADKRVTITLPDPDGIGMLVSPEIVNVYDAVGRLVSATDPNDNETTYVYNGLGQLVSTAFPDPDAGGPLGQPTTEYDYDKVGNLLTLTDPVANVTTWTYDAINRVESETNELNDTRSFEYDLAGNLSAKIDRLNRRTEFEYDALGRRTAEKWYNGMSLVRTIAFEYDAAHRLTEANDPDAVNYFTYDHRDRVTDEVMTFAGFDDTITLESAYDAIGNRTQTDLAFGTDSEYTTEFEYDALRRVTQLTRYDLEYLAATWHRAQFSYNKLGQHTEINRFEGDDITPIAVADTTFGYDGLNRLASILHTTGITTWAGYDYTYDVGSRILSIESYVDGLTEYDYDDTNQLIGADHATATDESYDYDENGNRDTGYTTGTNNQMLSDGTYNYTYDDEGNRLTRTNVSTGYVTEYAWDHRNRLVAVTEYDDESNVLSTVENAYDAFNRWIRQKVDEDGPGIATEVDRYFAYDRNQLTREFEDDHNAPTSGDDFSRYYSWGPSVDQLLADVGNTGGINWALTDHLGSVRDFVAYD
jgi:YD repeat-containing protein